MTTARDRLIEELFELAIELGPAERAAMLERRCGGDEELRGELIELLAEDDQGTESFLDQPMIRPVPASDEDLHPRQIGPFRTLETIGEGGMGVVYLAEQRCPVRRTVAVKVIKPGLDTRQVVARFEAERQALALMEHPCIARIYDGGETEDGRPFFAMEHVRGLPLIEHCDKERLSTHERLRLFRRVCDAVQHAHQKGIIHRDLKPSNVLVAVTDGKATPKVIDFGIARAITQPLTEKTLHTRHGRWWGRCAT